MPAKGAVDISNVIRKWAARVMRHLATVSSNVVLFHQPFNYFRT